MRTRFKAGAAGRAGTAETGTRAPARALTRGESQWSPFPVWPYQTLADRSSKDAETWDAFDPSRYLYERYTERERFSAALAAYYALRPLVPRRLQLALRRAYVPAQRSRKFPRWPIEPVLVEAQYEHLRGRLRRSGGNPIPFVNFWPDAKRFCFVLSHDVESEKGIDAIPDLIEVEQRYGFTSSWNFCAEQYPIPDGLFDELRAAGCEVGLHGILHDGKLFSSRAHFEADLPKIRRYLSDWQVDGFRSPATHRRAEWMPELGCAYDTSFPDTDPFEPIAGGCCSIFPFFIDRMVELPITLVQDHTWFEIMGGRSISPWIDKSEWIIRHHGLINLIFHPDYTTPERLEHYDRFLRFLRQQQEGWHALPRDVAQWWRTRSSLDLEAVAPGDCTGDPARLQPTIAYALEEAGNVVFRHDRPGRRMGPLAPARTAARPTQASGAVPASE